MGLECGVWLIGFWLILINWLIYLMFFKEIYLFGLFELWLSFCVIVFFKILLIKVDFLEFEILVMVINLLRGNLIFKFCRLFFVVFLIFKKWLLFIFCLDGIGIIFLFDKYCFVMDLVFLVICFGVLEVIILLLNVLVLGFILIN